MTVEYERLRGQDPSWFAVPNLLPESMPTPEPWSPPVPVPPPDSVPPDPAPRLEPETALSQPTAPVQSARHFIAGDNAVQGEVVAAGHGSVAAGNFNIVSPEALHEKHMQRLFGIRRLNYVDFEALSRVSASTVATEALEAQIDTLDQPVRMVALLAPPESGQSTAAKHLAFQFNVRKRNGTLDTTHEIEEEEWTLAELLHLQPEHAVVIVDYSESSRPLKRLEAEIDSVPPLLRKRDQHLILLLPSRLDLEAASWDFAYKLDRPDGREVFARQVAGRVSVPLSNELCANEWLSQRLSQAWPPEAARLAMLAVQLYDDGAEESASLVSQLRHVQGDWSEQLEEDYGAEDDAQTCALLLGAALFEGGAFTTMVESGDVLLRTSKWTSQPVHPLTQLSPRHRLKVLESASRFDAERRGFARPEYGEAVLPYVWSTFPRLRVHLRGWLGTLPFKLSALSQEDRTRMVSRILGLTRRQEAGVKLLADVAERWITRKDEAEKLPQRLCDAAHSAAVELLSEAAIDRKLGRRTRRLLYEWAYGEAGPRQKQAVARVCRGQLSRRYPLNALTRLKHLASHHDPGVRDETYRSLSAISKEMGTGTLLRLLGGWLDPQRPQSAEMVLRLLQEELSDASTLPILLGPFEDTWLREFWSRLLEHLEVSQLERLVFAVAEAAANAAATQETDDAVERFVALAAERQKSYDSLFHASSQFSADRWRNFEGAERFLLRIQIQLKERCSPALRAAAVPTREETT